MPETRLCRSNYAAEQAADSGKSDSGPASASGRTPNENRQTHIQRPPPPQIISSKIRRDNQHATPAIELECIKNKRLYPDECSERHRQATGSIKTQISKNTGHFTRCCLAVPEHLTKRQNHSKTVHPAKTIPHSKTSPCPVLHSLLSRLHLLSAFHVFSTVPRPSSQKTVRRFQPDSEPTGLSAGKKRVHACYRNKLDLLLVCRF